MDPNDLSEFKKLFIETARKHIQGMQSSLDELSQNNTSPESLNHFYIAAHSLRGESLALGYMSSATVSQLLEKIFFAAKEGTILLTTDLISAAGTAVRKLSESIDSVEKENKECVLNDERMMLEKASGISLD